jgi:hypothetical protein
MKKLILFLVFIMPLACFAITVYDIKYNFSNNSSVTYEAFLVRYDQNGGFIRVRFTDTRNNSVSLVNMNFAEEYRENKLYLVFKGNNPKYLRGNGQYDPDYFWFKKNDNDGKYYSIGVNSPSSDGKVTDGTILSINLLDIGVLTKDIVQNFFDSNEPLYRNLFAEVPAVKADFYEAPKFHLLLVANTKDETLSYSCENSKSRELNYFREIANQAGMLFYPKIIDAYDFNKSNVLTAIDNLKPGKNDVVVFYYNGHGFRYNSDTDPYPRLALTLNDPRMSINDNSIRLSDVNNMIKAKNARLSIVIGDCCNSFAPAPSAYGGAVTASSANTLSQANCMKLFLFSKGNIIATSATKGEYALYNMNPGGCGFFSTALLNSMDYYLSTFVTNPTWTDVLSNAKDKTSKSSAYAMCETPASSASCMHVPVFTIEQPNMFTNNFIKPNTKITAAINKLWVEYDVSENNVKGMRIHVNFTVYNYKGRTGYCSAYFYKSDGTPLKDYNNAYNTSTGNVATSNTFVPSFDNTIYNDYALFIPYTELHQSKGYYDLKLNVEIHSSDGVKYNSLTISEWQHFNFTQN